MLTCTTPDTGDIIVREEVRRGSPVYLLHRACGTDQAEFRNREEGIAHALPLGERHRVRVWLNQQGNDFVLLEDFRSAESV